MLAGQRGCRGSATFSSYIAAKRHPGQRGRLGHIDTRMACGLTAQIDPDDPQRVFDRMSKSIPVGRYGTAEEVANLAIWLLGLRNEITRPDLRCLRTASVLWFSTQVMNQRTGVCQRVR